MIYSMTGYGKSSREFEGKRITAEIKSLNSKQMDLKVRLPFEWRGKELTVRKQISTALERGKIDVNVSIEHTDTQRPATINAEIVKGYQQQLEKINGCLESSLPYTLDAILRLPEAVSVENEEPSEEEWVAITEVLNEAVQHITEFRAEEGASLQADFEAQIASINENLSLVKGLLNERRETKKQKLHTALAELKDQPLDENRFEQELIYYLEKLDINEEVVRLSQHCSYFSETLDGNKSNGKKLGFIAQEMGREINTMGAKANHTGIQQRVVQMKDDLEKIKEQVLNAL